MLVQLGGRVEILLIRYIHHLIIKLGPARFKSRKKAETTAAGLLIHQALCVFLALVHLLQILQILLRYLPRILVLRRTRHFNRAAACWRAPIAVLGQAVVNDDGSDNAMTLHFLQRLLLYLLYMHINPALLAAAVLRFQVLERREVVLLEVDVEAEELQDWEEAEGVEGEHGDQ